MYLLMYMCICFYKFGYICFYVHIVVCILVSLCMWVCEKSGILLLTGVGQKNSVRATVF